jgi:hypothetical protein
MALTSHFSDPAQVIQLAIGPVFLLTAVAATLNVLATRIGRIIDRARVLEDRLEKATPEQEEGLHGTLRVLSKRATLMNRAIGLSVTAGLLTALVVAALFVSNSLRIDLAVPITIAFVVGLLSLATGLVYFLREVILATNSLTFGGMRPRPPVAKQ